MKVQQVAIFYRCCRLLQVASGRKYVNLKVMVVNDMIIAEQYLSGFEHSAELLLIGPMPSIRVSITEPVIFVDGGSNIREGNTGITVGDGDSANQKMDISLNPAKDFSDLSFALDLIPSRFSRVLLAGFLGGRHDHHLLNYGAVVKFLDGRETTIVWFEREITAYSAGEWRFTVNGSFSLVVFQPTRVTLQGECKYHIPANTLVQPVSSFGLSNEGDGFVDMTCDAPVFIFHNDSNVSATTPSINASSA